MAITGSIVLSILESGFSKFSQHQTVVRQLSNGMDVIVCSMGENNSASVQVWVAAGSSTEYQWSGAGISHLLEHMIFKGSSKITGKQIGDRVKAIGGKINAYTSHERTVFFIDCPKEYVKDAIEILHMILSEPLFDRQELEKEKNVILREMDMRQDSPDREISETLWETAFRVHPYKIPVIGYPELFKKLTREDLVKYYKNFYGSEHCVLVVAGGIQIEDVLKKAEIFFSFQRSGPVKNPVALEPPQLSQKKIRKTMPVDIARFITAFHGPSFYSPDLYPMDMLSVILGQGRPSRLYQRLIQKENLVYSVDSWSYTPKDPGLFGIYCTLDAKNFEKVERIIFEEIEKIKEQGVKDEEIQRAKTKIESEYLFSIQTAHGTAADVGSNFVFTADPDFSVLYLKNIKKVDAVSIREAVKKYLTNERSVIAELCSEEKKTVEQGKTEKEFLSVEEIKLHNGIRLVIRPNPYANLVSIKALFLGGLRTDEQPGSSIVLSSMLESGTSKYNAQELALEIEKIGGQSSVHTGYNSIGWTIEVPPDNTGKAMDIMKSVLEDSVFPEDEFSLKKSQAIAIAKQGYEQPIHIALNRLRKELFGKHPYSNPPDGNPGDLQDIKIETVIKQAEDIINPQNMVLSIFGNFSKKETEDKIKASFGSIKPGKEFKIQQIPLDFPEAPKTIEEEFDGEGACIVIGFPGTTMYSDDRYILDVLANAMNDQGGSLYHRLRDEKALAYSLGSANISGIEQGAFIFHILTSKENVKEAHTEIQRFINSLAEQIEEKSIELAKAEAIGAQVLQTQTEGGLGFAVGLDVLYGMGADNQEKSLEKIKRIKIKDVKDVIQEYFNQDRKVTVILGPKDTQNIGDR
ncbi:hypothetical protein B9J78_00540 [bacterium Unc6]|nr:hypothetical protein [bacterium Unc6]